ncbi:MAG: 16S rRNA (uracil(1498)-N(3))-methyltransferase [Stellaceae bacterium]
MREHRAPRIYVTASLAPAAEVRLEPGQSHYLRSVLRLGRGAKVKAFSAADGEWLCTIAESGRGDIQLTVEHQLRAAEPEGEPGLWLVFAPIKRARLVWLIEKATELGASALVPVWTARTQSGRINLERLRAHAIEASEQSERLSVPELRVPEKLGALLTGWPAERRLIVCDETGAGEPIATAVTRLSPGPMALLVGPEGGFDQSELDAIDKFSFVTCVRLGPRVLRAETAALAALAVLQATAGDWRRTRTR